MGPLSTGFRYGVVAIVVALVSNLRFLFIDPASVPDWILTAIEEFRTPLALAAFLFLGILAALRVRPQRLDPEVPYRSLLLRDCTLAATVVAVMAGVTLFLLTALNATIFADGIRAYAGESAPKIVAYSEKVSNRLNEPQPVPAVEEIEAALQPPVLRDLGRSMANIVLRTLLVGTAGALVGAIRGSYSPESPTTTSAKNGSSPDGREGPSRA